MRECCTDKVASEQFSSPFSRLVALKYYDGPIEGFVECGTCKTVFSFKLVDWDDGQDFRIFLVREAVGLTLEQLANALGAGEPCWPSWVPDGVLPFDPFIKVGLSGRQLIIAAEDLLRQIRMWRHMPADEGDRSQTGWFEWVGLSRRSPYDE